MPGEEKVWFVATYRYLQYIAHTFCMVHTPPRTEIHLNVKEEKRMNRALNL